MGHPGGEGGVVLGEVEELQVELRREVVHRPVGRVHELGAELAITYLNEKAKDFVEPLATAMQAPLFLPLDVSRPGELEAVFDRIAKDWGTLDILVHSIAWAPKDDLQGGLLNCTAEGFAKSMDISCHSFVRMARLAAP
ncbi:MAG: SDR family oxidoreductase, partial [Planctomycetaceae bacterium]|nr:SDR family oxidoreductase [Planctomycetaceae bacterium]